MPVVWTEMCVGSVYTQQPYNDKNPPSVFFFVISLNVFPFLKSSRLTEAPPTIVDWQ